MAGSEGISWNFINLALGWGGDNPSQDAIVANEGFLVGIPLYIYIYIQKRHEVGTEDAENSISNPASTKEVDEENTSFESSTSIK